MDDRELWTAVVDGERRDVLPEMWSGHNIADFVDSDIDARLAALDTEEDAAAAAWAAQASPSTRSPYLPSGQRSWWGGRGIQVHGCVWLTRTPVLFNRMFLPTTRLELETCCPPAQTLNH